MEVKFILLTGHGGSRSGEHRRQELQKDPQSSLGFIGKKCALHLHVLQRSPYKRKNRS